MMTRRSFDYIVVLLTRATLTVSTWSWPPLLKTSQGARCKLDCSRQLAVQYGLRFFKLPKKDQTGKQQAGRTLGGLQKPLTSRRWGPDECPDAYSCHRLARSRRRGHRVHIESNGNTAHLSQAAGCRPYTGHGRTSWPHKHVKLWKPGPQQPGLSGTTFSTCLKRNHEVTSLYLTCHSLIMSRYIWKFGTEADALILPGSCQWKWNWPLPRITLWGCYYTVCVHTTLAKKIETTARTWHRRVICRACTRLCLACVPVSIFLARVVSPS